MAKYQAPGGVTQEVWNSLTELYAALDKTINLIGLEYTEDDEYVCTNTDQVEEEWCDENLLASLDQLYLDLGDFLK